MISKGHLCRFQSADRETEARGGTKKLEAVTHRARQPIWVMHTLAFLGPGNAPAMSPGHREPWKARERPRDKARPLQPQGPNCCTSHVHTVLVNKNQDPSVQVATSPADVESDTSRGTPSCKCRWQFLEQLNSRPFLLGLFCLIMTFLSGSVLCSLSQPAAPTA